MNHERFAISITCRMCGDVRAFHTVGEVAEWVEMHNNAHTSVTPVPYTHEQRIKALERRLDMR